MPAVFHVSVPLQNAI